MSRDLPPLNALKAFEATARLNSVSQAAEQLHVTHGAVSRQLKVLEEHLGVSLFVKDGRGLKLTDAGVRLRDASGEAFDRLRSVCAELTQRTADAPFVLGCSGSLLARWFIPRLGRLNADLPDLVPVSGTVTLDGKPVSGVTVTFIPTGATGGGASYGATDASGKYELKSNDGRPGAVAGEFKVACNKWVKADGSDFVGEQQRADGSCHERADGCGGKGRRTTPAPRHLVAFQRRHDRAGFARRVEQDGRRR